MRVKKRNSFTASAENGNGSTSSEDSPNCLRLHTDEASIERENNELAQEDIGCRSILGASLSKSFHEYSSSTSLSYKISKDRFKKPSSRKYARKIKETETPSKDAAYKFSSMELSMDENMPQIQFGQDMTMLDADNLNEIVSECDENKQETEFMSEEVAETLDVESITSSIEREYEKEMLWAQKSEYSKEIARMVGPDHPSIPTSYNSMEKSRKKYAGGPVDPNGRCKGRKLVLWHRPRMMEKLLLNIQYECFKAKLRIPWDEIVHRLEPGCSGPSAVQMLNKMRDVLIMEGHMIPPAMGNGIQTDPDIRGYVRDLDAEYPGGTRILRWTENYPNASQSLSDSGFVRGSGNYRKVVTRGGAFNKIPRTIEERGHLAKISKARKVIPEEAYSPSATFRAQSGCKNQEKKTSFQPRRGKPRALWKKPGPKVKSKSKSTSRSTPDTQASSYTDDGFKSNGVNVDSNAYDDRSSISRIILPKRASRDGTSSENSEFNECLEIQYDESSSPRLWSNCQEVRLKSASKSQFCEVSNGNIKIHLSPVALARIDAGLPIHHPNPMGGQLMDGVNMLSAYQKEKPAEYFTESIGSGNLRKKTVEQSYQGVEEHGTLPDYVQALASGRDPRVNGWKYLRLAERLEKIGQHSIDHGVKPEINNEPLATHGVLDGSSQGRYSGSQHSIEPWPYNETVPGLHSSITSIADDLSTEYEIGQQNHLYESVMDERYYSSSRGSQKYNTASQNCEENKSLSPFAETIFSSPGIIENAIQECRFSPSGIVFDDTITGFSESMVDSRSDVRNCYGENETVGDDNYQISAWQNEFLNDHQDGLPEID